MSVSKRFLVLGALTILYPLTTLLVQEIPNPMLVDGYLALNMVFPVLAGFLLGPRSGALSGGVGTALAALLYQSPFDAAAIIPHSIMGLAAGLLGRKGSELPTSLALVLGHALNMCVFLAFGLIEVRPQDTVPLLLGLGTEAMVGIAVVALAGQLLKGFLYRHDRW